VPKNDDPIRTSLKKGMTSKQSKQQVTMKRGRKRGTDIHEKRESVASRGKEASVNNWRSMNISTCQGHSRSGKGRSFLRYICEGNKNKIRGTR